MMQAADDICHVYTLYAYLIVSDVKVPLLILNALDDPIVPPQCIPYEEVSANTNLVLATTDKGGHVACIVCFLRFLLYRDPRVER